MFKPFEIGEGHYFTNSDLNKLSVEFNWKLVQSSVNELYKENV